jgi:hypothetical protein
MATITIPLNATVRVRRPDGSVDTYVFRGTDDGGLIYEDVSGQRHRDVGVYIGIAIDLPVQHFGQTSSYWRLGKTTRGLEPGDGYGGPSGTLPLVWLQSPYPILRIAGAPMILDNRASGEILSVDALLDGPIYLAGCTVSRTRAGAKLWSNAVPSLRS